MIELKDDEKVWLRGMYVIAFKGNLVVFGRFDCN